MKKQKKTNWSDFKELLFVYLAITKILYWMDALTMGTEGFDFLAAGQVFMTRLLERDILLILSIIAFFWLDKALERKKIKHNKFIEYALFYAIGFVILAGIAAAYIGLLSLILGPIQVDSWASFIGYGVLSYVVVAVALNIKLYFKFKAKPDFSTNEDKIQMLKTLEKDGIITKDECDKKVEMLQ